MVCQHPVNLNGQTFPCGRCVACRMQRTSQWSIRLIHELDYHHTASFVTLTYNDMYLPADYELKPKHLTDFFKRLRFNNPGRKIKYYACGEYGENYLRPHYHIILYGVGIKEKEVIEDSWSFGFVKLGSVTPQSCRYVASYIMDKEQAIESSKWTGPRQPPFQRSSLGLGKQWCIDNKSDLLKELKLRNRGKKIGLPRYYCKLLKEDITDDLRDSMTLARSKERDDELARIGVTYLGRADYEREYRKQKIEEFKTIDNNRKSKKKLV